LSIAHSIRLLRAAASWKQNRFSKASRSDSTIGPPMIASSRMASSDSVLRNSLSVANSQRRASGNSLIGSETECGNMAESQRAPMSWLFDLTAPESQEKSVQISRLPTTCSSPAQTSWRAAPSAIARSATHSDRDSAVSGPQLQRRPVTVIQLNSESTKASGSPDQCGV